MFPIVLDYTVLVLFMLILITQIAIPVWNGTKLLPLLRKRYKKVDKQIVSAKTDLEVARLEKVVKTLREEKTSTK